MFFLLSLLTDARKQKNWSIGTRILYTKHATSLRDWRSKYVEKACIFAKTILRSNAFLASTKERFSKCQYDLLQFVSWLSKRYSITTDFNSKKFARYFCSVLGNGHTRTLIGTGQYINLSWCTHTHICSAWPVTYHKHIYIFSLFLTKIIPKLNKRCLICIF